MRKFTLSSILLLSTGITVLQGQTLDLPQKHRIGLGPMVGYDFKLKGTAYGAGLMYEYKPFRTVGFTAALNYEQTQKNAPSDDFSNTGSARVKHQLYAASIGARYYFNSFYLGGALGLAHETGQTRTPDGNNYNGGSINSLYSALGLGYQLPLKNGDLMEMEIGTFGTKNSRKFGGTVKYKFLR